MKILTLVGSKRKKLIKKMTKRGDKALLEDIQEAEGYN